MTGLCDACNALDLADIVDRDVVHQPSIEALELAASSCPLCSLFYRGLTGGDELPRDPYEGVSWSSIGERIYLRGEKWWNEDETRHRISALTVQWGTRNPESTYSLYVQDPQDVEEIAEGRFIFGRALSTAEDSVEVLKKWMKRCDEEHEHCLPKSVCLPTRVVDVGDSTSDPRLFEPDDLVIAEYATLSHCWGNKALLKTTTKNITQHTKSIPFSSLQKTFREAIQITRAVGIQYLWIDSLCIIQDDDLDWQRESSVMSDIYQNSSLNIGASASSDSSGGCFMPRSREEHVPVKYSFDQKSGDRTTIQVYVRPLIRSFPQLPLCALQGRGWTLQERFLSRRMVHFDTDQTLWECREARWTEDEVPEEVYLNDSSTPRNNSWTFRIQLRRDKVSRDLMRDWELVVENFTARGITRASDKLPALSGLASVLEEMSGDRYVAGLWQSHLPLGLLWRKASTWLREPTEGGYRAPSWSWASLDGEIDMFDPTLRVNVDVAAKDSHVKIQPCTKDPHGRLSSGTLTITGMMRTADGQRPDGDDDLPSGLFVKKPGVERLCDQGVEIGIAMYDLEASQSPRRDRVHCLQIARLPGWQAQMWYGLLLEPTEGRENEYRRVGTCEGNLSIDGHFPSKTSWFDEGLESTITVI